MHKRIYRWFVGAMLALVLAAGLVTGGSQPPVAYGADPTPTPTPLQTDSQPGGSGGGH